MALIVTKPFLLTLMSIRTILFLREKKQECIPVGCVPPTCYHTGGGSLSGGVCLGGLPDRDPPPWTESQTGVKTLPCHSNLVVAGGKNADYIRVIVVSVSQCMVIRDRDARKQGNLDSVFAFLRSFSTPNSCKDSLLRPNYSESTTDVIH